MRAADVNAAEKQRTDELDKRRKAAEAEAAAIRAMMAAPKKVLTAKKPEEAKPGVEIKGTIHKPTAKPGTPGAPAAPGAAEARREEIDQVREALVELGRRRRQEARGAQDARRRRRSRRLARAARRRTPWRAR